MNHTSLNNYKDKKQLEKNFNIENKLKVND